MKPPPAGGIAGGTRKQVMPLRLVAAPEPLRHRRLPGRRRLWSRALLTFLATGLLWVAVRLSAEAKAGGEALPFGRGILKVARNGPLNYWLVWLVIVANLLVHIVARRGERQERSRSGARARKPAPQMGVLVHWKPQSMAAARWSVPVIALSAAILLLSFPGHQSFAHWILWTYAAIGTAMNVQAASRRRPLNYSRR
jgi:hypothetical protein